MTGCPRLIGQERSALWSREEATGSEQQRGKDQGGVRVLLFFVIVPLRSSSFYFTLLLFRLFLFRQVHQQARQGWTRQDQNVRRQQCGTAQAGGRRGRRVCLPLFYFLLFAIISFSVERDNRKKGWGVPTQATMITRDRRGDRQAQWVSLYSVIVILSTVLFSSSPFCYLFFLSPAATAMRDGTGGRRAGGGGRKREEGGGAGGGVSIYNLVFFAHLFSL